MDKNYAKMWEELKERIPRAADADGLIILSDMDDIIEELENEWTILFKRSGNDLIR